MGSSASWRENSASICILWKKTRTKNRRLG
jgi:hypothetical protein